MRPIDADKLKIRLETYEYTNASKMAERGGNEVLHYFMPKVIDDEPTFKHEGCCICGADAQMFKLKCSNTKQTLHICWNCAKDITEQHFPSLSKQNFKIELNCALARWKEVEPRELICTNCGGYAPMNFMHEHYVETAFCPHCGARIEKGD